MDKTMLFTGLKMMFTMAVKTLLLVLISTAYASGYSGPGVDTSQAVDSLPKFQETTKHITGLVGETVYLPCSVHNLGDRVVSWIRSKDLHILTSGIHTYTSDSRIQVLHKAYSNSWNLRIFGAKHEDEGKYECQVNTDPKVNMAVFLTIRENDMRDSPYEDVRAVTTDWRPTASSYRAHVLGPPEQYVRLGSTVTFTCIIEAPYLQGHPPRFVNWFHAGRLVTFQAARGGISMETDKTSVQTSSRLTVAGVTRLDEGNYTCVAAGVTAASVMLVVVDGEHTEAMQRDSVAESSSPSVFLVADRRRHFVTFLCVFHCWWTYRRQTDHIT